jgi:hypothetical protein
MRPEAEAPVVVQNGDNPQVADHKKMERMADRAAHKASKTEQTYDQGHNTFSN